MDEDEDFIPFDIEEEMEDDYDDQEPLWGEEDIGPWNDY